MMDRHTTTKLLDRFRLSGSHPVLAAHQVYGQQVLPGLAYIDLLYSLWQEHGFDPFSAMLHNLAIYRPLVIQDAGSLQIDVSWNAISEGTWHIVVEGEDEQGGERTRFVTAEMHQGAETAFDERIDLEALRASAGAPIDLAKIYATGRDHGLVHGDFMQARGHLYTTPSGVHVECRLGEAAEEASSRLLFHPALIDGAAVAIGMSDAGLADRDAAQGPPLFVPLFYESFHASAPLRGECVARVMPGSVQQRNELRSLTLEFFASDGAKTAELRNLTVKFVRDPSAMAAGNPPPQHMSTQPPAATQRGAGTAEPAETLIRRVLGHRLNVPGDRLDAEQSVFELGFDSAALLDIATQLERETGLSLAPTLLFEHPTIAALAAHLSQPARSSAVRRQGAVLPQHRGAALDEPIAIVGISGRYPLAPSLETLWERLSTGADCIRSVPPARWPLRRFYCADKKKAARRFKSYSRFGGFMDDIDRFDFDFFGLKPQDVAAGGLKELLFLDVASTLFESAGYSRESLKAMGEGDVGVFVGTMPGTHHHFGRRSRRNPVLPPMFTAGIAQRVSGHFGLQGPSVVIDTQSSSSLTAVHLACESLRRGECRMAVAGGVSLLYPELFEVFSRIGVVGSRADSRSFSDGDGLLLAEGVGAVLLKPLTQAQADGDHILALVRATAVRHAGTKQGDMVPSVGTQVQLFTEVLDKAGVDARTVSCVESAAYGSPVGDSIEVAALTRAFREHTGDRQFCSLGSVKSNIGHAEAASGMSQLAKVVLQLQHGQLAPLRVPARLNPNLRLEASPFRLQTRLQAWERPVVEIDGMKTPAPRRAMVNSFGAGGAYASLIVDEYVPGTAQRADDAGAQVVVLSALSPQRLQAQAVQLLDFLSLQPTTDLADLAYTLQLGRDAMAVRMAVVVESIADLRQALERFIATGGAPGEPPTRGDDLPRLLAQRDLSALAAHWAAGAQVPWHQLHGARRRRIPLPTSVLQRISAADHSSTTTRHDMPTPDARANVARTAYLTTFSRALGHRLGGSSGIDTDAFAEGFLPETYTRFTRRPKLGRWLQNLVMPGAFGYFNARTRYFDEILRAESARGIDQLVLLGAGFDSRALRFATLLDGVRVFEVDMPQVLQLKAARSEELGLQGQRAVSVPIDFERDDLRQTLMDHDFEPGRRSLFFWEGVSYYLPLAAVESVLANVAALSGEGSSLVFDYVTRAFFEGDLTAYGAKPLAKGWKRLGNVNRSGMADLASFLRPLGYELLEEANSDALERACAWLPGRKTRVWGMMRIARYRRVAREI